MLVKKENITEIIPQRSPFVMIHDLVEATIETGFKSKFSIEEDNIFLKNGVVSEASLVENIAQTCAAGFGYIDRQNGMKEAQLGFIGAVTKLKVRDVARLNDQLDTHVRILSTFDKIFLVKGEVLRAGKVLIECQMKIVLT